MRKILMADEIEIPLRDLSPETVSSEDHLTVQKCCRDYWMFLLTLIESGHLTQLDMMGLLPREIRNTRHPLQKVTGATQRGQTGSDNIVVLNVMEEEKIHGLVTVDHLKVTEEIEHQLTSTDVIDEATQMTKEDQIMGELRTEGHLSLVGRLQQNPRIDESQAGMISTVKISAGSLHATGRVPTKIHQDQPGITKIERELASQVEDRFQIISVHLVTSQKIMTMAL